MKQTHILFDDPGNYPNQNPYPYEGSSPKFTKTLTSYFKKYAPKIKSIQLALYLFNNLELHHFFIQLAKQGILINVISIPLEGYDDSSPQNIMHSNGTSAFHKKQTKLDLASEVYSSFTSNPKNYNLYLFPHTYIRSPRIKAFSRGKIPYSLHIKSILIEFHSGEFMTGLFSSNLAIRDAIKHDTFVMRLANKEEASIHAQFFCDLIENSTPLKEYKEPDNTVNAQVTMKNNAQNSALYFMAPFYSKSPEEVEKRLIHILENAQKRIWIVAQHLSAYTYEVPLNFKVKTNVSSKISKNGILHKALQKGTEGVEIKCISQTYSDASSSNAAFRKPLNSYNFQKFIRAFKELPNSSYFVNHSVHSKYIIVDDKVIVTTFNYTPTQFIYLPKVSISKFQHIAGLQYKGVFSEVGQMMLLTKKSETDCFVKNFEFLKTRSETIRVI